MRYDSITYREKCFIRYDRRIECGVLSDSTASLILDVNSSSLAAERGFVTLTYTSRPCSVRTVVTMWYILTHKFTLHKSDTQICAWDDKVGTSQFTCCELGCGSVRESGNHCPQLDMVTDGNEVLDVTITIWGSSELCSTSSQKTSYNKISGVTIRVIVVRSNKAHLGTMHHSILIVRVLQCPSILRTT